MGIKIVVGGGHVSGGISVGNLVCMVCENCGLGTDSKDIMVTCDGLLQRNWYGDCCEQVVYLLRSL